MRGRKAGGVTCGCGKRALYKCMVAMYPLGRDTRKLSSSPVFGVCKDCIAPGKKSVNTTTLAQLKISFNVSSDKTLANLAEVEEYNRTREKRYAS